jgi:hypothetical protein
VLTGGVGAALVGDGPTQVEAVATDVLPCADGIRVNAAEPQLEDASGGDALAPGSPRGCGTCLPRDIVPSVSMPAPGSSDIVGLEAIELGLSSYPRALPQTASWRLMERGAELTRSRVIHVGWLLHKTLATIDQEVLQPSRVSPKAEKRFLPEFLWSFLASLMSSFLCFPA